MPIVHKNLTQIYQSISFIAKVATCDLQQCGILTSVDSDEPVQPPFKLKNCQKLDKSLLVCLFVNFFSVKGFSATAWLRTLKYGTKLDMD